MQANIASVMSTLKVFKGHWMSLKITWGQTYNIGCQTITATPRDAIFTMYNNMTFIIESCYMSVASEFIKFTRSQNSEVTGDIMLLIEVNA